jgi:chromate transporter
MARMIRIALVGVALWWLPILLVGAWHGWNGTLFQAGVFFSKAAMVTFGGAYAVLPYVAQQAVDHYGWLNTVQMMDGLGLAETTPGPLIMVLQFVGFMGGWSHPGALPPLAAATLGALITTWATFVPCFIWIFLGAPYIERLRGNAQLNTALSAVTAAVVGVILNLAVWFGIHALFPQGRVDWVALAFSAVAFLLLLKWKLDVLVVVLLSGLAGLVYQLAF